MFEFELNEAEVDGYGAYRDDGSLVWLGVWNRLGDIRWMDSEN